MAKNNPTPHDSLFKATMSHVSEVILFMKTFFPAYIWENLDFSTLRPYTTTFINDDLEDYYCDINYTCEWKDGSGKVLLSLFLNIKAIGWPSQSSSC